MSGESYFDRTRAENFLLFLNSLRGVLDDAITENYSDEGIRLLQEALEDFESDYRIRYAGLDVKPVEKPK
ncbi:MAG TPA: hypothetical protein VGR19_10400 [Allosphingosinicella sp.]|nr:hypothetical protein [Allosphingosinicella sp.]